MRIVRSLRSFHRRRIGIPVEGGVARARHRVRVTSRTGAPTSCSTGSSGASTPSSAAAGSAARVNRPMFDADAAAMPFADGVFDYVVCSHMLEHVVDPAGVVAEMVRVGRAGYIEVPDAASAKILDFPSHLWWCRIDGSTLVMSAKQSAAFDPEIQA